MKEEIYHNIVKHYESCYDKYGDNCHGVDWPNKEDVETRYRIMLEIIRFDTFHTSNSACSVMDFGCGLAHLLDYIKRNNYPYQYMGVDLSPVFVDACKEKYPQESFVCIDFLKEDNYKLSADYIVMNGVLTEKNGYSFDNMWEYSKSIIKKVFEACNKGVAFNVMSSDVDWEREDLFHLPLNELSHFLTTEVTRDFIIRYDYGLYEYTVYIYKRRI